MKRRIEHARCKPQDKPTGKEIVDIKRCSTDITMARPDENVRKLRGYDDRAPGGKTVGASFGLDGFS